jgi:hypothetical protein
MIAVIRFGRALTTEDTESAHRERIECGKRTRGGEAPAPHK